MKMISMNKDLTPNPRAVAAGIVGEWLKTGAFPDHLIESVDSHRAFVMEVVYGVARWKRTLEWVLKRCAERRPDAEVMPYLYVGIYQVFMMDNMEDYAAVNETVEIVKQSGMPHLAAFVNAILRRILREKSFIAAELAEQPVAVQESHPDVLVNRWQKQFGEKKALALMKWNNARPDVVLRVNRGRISFGPFMEQLAAAGIEAVPHSFAPEECVMLPHGVSVEEVPGYDTGLFSVQDPSTLVAVRLLDPLAGEFVLDACAAPGGKTSLIAERMGGKGRIVAMDIQTDRVEIVRENLRRLGIKSVTLTQGDAASEGDIKKVCDNRLFDRILLDMPCTNTGVLRRRADARWRFTKKGLGELVELQRKILANMVNFVKPGGLIVYSTCSLETEEGEGVIESFLSTNQGFEKAAVEKIFPPETRTDGAFVCAIRRKAG